ncbi:MAG TPA: outer membrane beta-barrel protein [Puia sp.]
MKKVFLVLVFFVSTRGLAQVKMGIEGGYNAARFAQSPETILSDNGYSPFSISTFNAGIVLEIHISKKIFLQPELLYFGNGTIINGHGGDAGYENSSHEFIEVYYLRLPVNVVYKIKLTDKLHVLVGTGLYGAKGLSGRGKGNIEESGPSSGPSAYAYNSKVNFSGDNSSANQTNIKPVDVGFDLLAGIEWNNFQLQANYSRGFSPIFNDVGYHYKNVVSGVSLLFIFPTFLH